jgi:glycosyltransferase involved in cell wall biosynthesis
MNKSGSVLNRPKRLALVHDCTAYGGLEAHVLLLARYLDPARYTPLIVVPGYTDEYRASPPRFIEEAKALGFPVLQPVDPGNTKLVSYLRDIKNIRALFRQNQIDLVHIHTRRPVGARKATLAAKAANLPALVRTEHVTPSVGFKKPYKYLVKPFDLLTDRIITVSEANRQEQISLLGRSPQKVVTCQGGIELERFNPVHDVAEAKRKLGLDPTLPVVGTVGRLSEEKGHTYFISAAAEVIQQRPVNFLLVGTGPLETQLKEQAKRLGLEDHFHFAGFQSNPIPYIEAMDLTVMSSLNEAQGLALLEFMAMGKAPVVTDLPSFKEIVTDGQNGLVVASASGSALASGILKLLGDTALREQMAQAALEKVRQQFSIQRMVNDLMDLYDNLLGIETTRPVQREDKELIRS